MLDVGISSAHHLHRQLVQGIIIALAKPHRPPRITALHLPLHTDLLRLLAKGFLLRLIFQLQEQPLLLEGLYGRCGHEGLRN